MSNAEDSVNLLLDTESEDVDEDRLDRLLRRDPLTQDFTPSELGVIEEEEERLGVREEKLGTILRSIGDVIDRQKEEKQEEKKIEEKEIIMDERKKKRKEATERRRVDELRVRAKDFGLQPHELEVVENDERIRLGMKKRADKIQDKKNIEEQKKLDEIKSNETLLDKLRKIIPSVETLRGFIPTTKQIKNLAGAGRIITAASALAPLAAGIPVIGGLIASSASILGSLGATLTGIEGITDAANFQLALDKQKKENELKIAQIKLAQKIEAEQKGLTEEELKQSKKKKISDEQEIIELKKREIIARTSKISESRQVISRPSGVGKSRAPIVSREKRLKEQKEQQKILSDKRKLSQDSIKQLLKLVQAKPKIVKKTKPISKPIIKPKPKPKPKIEPKPKPKVKDKKKPKECKPDPKLPPVERKLDVKICNDENKLKEEKKEVAAVPASQPEKKKRLKKKQQRTEEQIALDKKRMAKLRDLRKKKRANLAKTVKVEIK